MNTAPRLPLWFARVDRLHRRILKIAHQRTGRPMVEPYSLRDISTLSHGLTGEAGEVAQEYKKYERGDFTEAEYRARVVKELADVRIYTAMLAYAFDIDLDAAVEAKLNEVEDHWAAVEANLKKGG